MAPVSTVDMVDILTSAAVAKEPQMLQDILIGIKNALAHGDVLRNVGMEVPEKQLKKLHDGLEAAIKAAGKIQGKNE